MIELTSPSNEGNSNSSHGRDDNSDNVVVPLSLRRRDRSQRSDESWRFTATVHYVTGREGEWLSKELARAIRELLVWARGDELVEADGQDEEQAAA
nr:hypothetical protein [Kibdelosporangium sp. MJ126-NF4]